MTPPPNPLPCTLLTIGAVLCVVAVGYDDASNLLEYPSLIGPAGALLASGCALIGLFSRNAAADRAALLFGTFTAGYVGNDVLLGLRFGQDLEGALLLAALGCVALLFGALMGFLGGSGAASVPGRMQASAQATSWGQTTPAAAAVAPAGWYPDPSGGSGLRYWDGQEWGATSN